ncbi:Cyclin-dependent kinase 3 [Tetrabaena socialis]|uniref:cyclin-dependent kinase n=1 Tax=Tetrabaena socialis TaxID=47790 RepID=A0A2J8A9K4_9CHLO|nr:Cyclin-dependent kinase 3 [Tetrabaena socialis]|eukprot:PNH09190.1 Cyclin-dependent kinase 3 [Tetrabaena socialis]
MGRMVPADRIALSGPQKQVLIVSAAARMSGLDTEAFDVQVQELLTLLPDLRERLLSLKPSILVELCLDTRGVAIKLIQLRELFPEANVSALVSRRPTLLTDGEWPGVVAAHAKLHSMFPEGGVCQMVTQQPLLLVEEVDELEIDTLHKIFQVLGTPDEAMWPGLADLPHWRGSPSSAFPRWRGRAWEEIAPRLDAEGRDLIRRMLTYDPAQRITAGAALRHPYFDGIEELLAHPPDLP